MPPSIMMPLVVSRLTTLLRDAGPLHDAELCSQIEQCDQVGGDRDARAAARAARHALGVVGIAGLAAPRARPRSCRRAARTSPSPGPSHATPVVAAVRDGVDDRALRAQVGDVGRVDLRHIHREVDVVAAGRAHVFRVVPVLQREHDAVHRQLRQIRLACRTARRARRRAPAHRAACGTPRTPPARRPAADPSTDARSHSPLQVTERSPRMLSVSSAFSWPAFGMPTRMPNCCCTLGSEIVGSMRPNSSGRPWYSIEVREDASTTGDGLGRKRERRAGAHGALRRRESACRPPSPARCRCRCRPWRARCSLHDALRRWSRRPGWRRARPRSSLPRRRSRRLAPLRAAARAARARQ